MALPLSKTSIESVIHYVQLNSYILAEKKIPKKQQRIGGGWGGGRWCILFIWTPILLIQMRKKYH